MLPVATTRHAGFSRSFPPLFLLPWLPQVSFLSKNIEKLLDQAQRGLRQHDDWVDVIQSLESAAGIVRGNGPGGDL